MIKMSRSKCLVCLLIFSIFSNLAYWILSPPSAFIRKPRISETQAESTASVHPQYTARNGKDQRSPAPGHKTQTIKGTLYRHHFIRGSDNRIRSAVRRTKHSLPSYEEQPLAANNVSLHSTKPGLRVEHVTESKLSYNTQVKKAPKGTLYRNHLFRGGDNRSSVRSTKHSLPSHEEQPPAVTNVSLQSTKPGIRVEHLKESKLNYSINTQVKKAPRSHSHSKVKLERSSKKRNSSFIPKVVCGNTSDLTDIDSIATSQRPQVDLFVAVITAPNRLSRRTAIRQTWLSTAKYNPSVAYRFFTDGKGLSFEMEAANLLKERKSFEDLEFLPTAGGYWFSHRLLYALFWAFERFDFKFFLRIDDDYFVCLNNLLANVQHRKEDKFLYWGWMHCVVPKQIRIDEGFLILGVDLVREIVQRNKSLCCHPFGDQMVAMWVNRLEQEGVNVTYFVDNERVVHHRKHLKRGKESLCENVIGIHQAYPELMAKYWNISKGYRPSPGSYKIVGIKKYEDYCKYPKGLDWRAFLRTFWGYQPKPCWEPGAVWPELVGRMFHVGRAKN